MKNMKILIFGLIAMLSGLGGCARHYKASDIYNRGYAEYMSGDTTKAIGYYKWALEIKKEYAPAMLGLAQCYLEEAKKNLREENTGASMHDLEEALYWCNLATDADPGNAEVTQTRVKILSMRGEVEDAIKTAKWGTRVQGQTSQSLILMARTYIEVGSYDEAEIAIKQAIAVDPNNVQAHILAGKFYEKIGKSDKALYHYEEAFRLDPTNAEVEELITKQSGAAAQ
jgi:tetratricopeptide (TPR) repeat protein